MHWKEILFLILIFLFLSFAIGSYHAVFDKVEPPDFKPRSVLPQHENEVNRSPGFHRAR